MGMGECSFDSFVAPEGFRFGHSPSVANPVCLIGRNHDKGDLVAGYAGDPRCVLPIFPIAFFVFVGVADFRGDVFVVILVKCPITETRNKKRQRYSDGDQTDGEQVFHS